MYVVLYQFAQSLIHDNFRVLSRFDDVLFEQLISTVTICANLSDHQMKRSRKRKT